MLAIAGEVVDMTRAVREQRPSTVLSSRAPDAPPAFIQGGRMRSETGVFGDPTLATVEKGRVYCAAKIDDLERGLAELREAQTTLQAETKVLGETAGKGSDGANAERLAKLEEQLSLIASGSTGASGGVPELAAISGKIAEVETSLAAKIAELGKSRAAWARDVALRAAPIQ